MAGHTPTRPARTTDRPPTGPRDRGQRAGRALFVVRHRWAVIAATLVVMSLAGLLGGDVADRLSSGGFDDPQAESARAAALLAERFDGGVPNLVAVVDASDLATPDAS